MAIIDLSAYLYSVLDTLKSFFSYHQAQKCTTSSAIKPAVDIESAQMQSVQIIAASSSYDAVEQQKQEQPSCSTIEEEDEKEESEDEEEVEDEEEEEELENAEGDIRFAEVNMGRTGKGFHEVKYRDEVIIMSSSFSSGSRSTSSSSESSSDSSSEYSDSEEDEEGGSSSSVSSLELDLSPPSPTARGSLFGRVLTMFGGAKYPNEVDTDYTALNKCGKNGQLNLV